MQRFYSATQVLSVTFSCDKKDPWYHQMIKVLRYQIGDECIFFDGKSMRDHVYRITEISSAGISFEHCYDIEKQSENSERLVLYQALPNKLSKLEYIVQKGVEVGYHRFVFFRSLRSQKLKLSDSKQDRLNKIIVEAAEQSGRNICPSIGWQDDLIYPEMDEQNRVVFFHPDQTETRSHLSELVQHSGVSSVKQWSLFVGPEGGFSDDEIEQFRQRGYQNCSLGNRILRAETAAVVAGFYLAYSGEKLKIC